MPSDILATFNRGLNVSWPHLVLFTVYLVYVFAGGGLFLLLEGGYTDDKKDDVDRFLALRRELGEAIRNVSRGLESTAGNLTDLWETYLTREKKLGQCDYDNTTMGWTFTGSVLFCVTTIATIGYGDPVPVTPTGRAAIVIYSLIGIPLTLTFLADIGGLLARIVITIVGKCRCRRRAKTSQTTAVEGDIEKAPAVDGVEPPQRDRPSTRSALNEDGNLMDLRMSLGIFQDSSDPVRGSLPCSRRNSIDEEISEMDRMGSTAGCQNLGFTKETNHVEETKTANKMSGMAGTNKETGETSEAEHDRDDDSNNNVQKHVPVIVVMGILIVYTLVGALMIAEVEDWNYGDALYFTFVTLTTIGFGDFVPVKHYMDITSFFGCMIYTICGLSVMSMCLALVQAKVVMLMSRVAAKIGF